MKDLIIITLALIISPLMKGQSPFGKSYSQEMIENAITSGIYIIEQDYQLCDSTSGQLFGKNQKAQFGTLVSTGVAINNKIVANNRLYTPLNFDESYTKYHSKYKPYLTDKRYRLYNDTTACNMESSIDNLETFKIAPNHGKTDVKGWMVYVFKDGQNKIDMTIYAKTENPYSNGEIDVTEWGKYNILGGYFFTVDYSSPGLITLELDGFLQYDSNDKWKLLPIQEGQDSEVNSENRTMSDDSPSELTPVGKRGDKDGKDGKKGDKKKKKR